MTTSTATAAPKEVIPTSHKEETVPGEPTQAPDEKEDIPAQTPTKDKDATAKDDSFKSKDSSKEKKRGSPTAQPEDQPDAKKPALAKDSTPAAAKNSKEKKEDTNNKEGDAVEKKKDTIMKEEPPAYKMGIVMCTGTEHVHVEEIPNARGFGVLANETIGGFSWFAIKDFLRKYAWTQNDDDTYLNEGQLRKLWKDFVVPRYCGSPNGRCKGCCAALPGDTVYWESSDWGYPESYKYKPGTQEELEERGWLGEQGGYLVARAGIAREDPSQLNDETDEQGS